MINYKKFINKNLCLAMSVTLLLVTTGCGATEESSSESSATEVKTEAETNSADIDTKTKAPSKEVDYQEGDIEYTINGNTLTYQNSDYQIIQVDGGDRSGDRQANVAVDIGFGDREYWGLTSEHGQLVYVLANEIILQDDDTEPVNSDGRYYPDEANVPGTEEKDLDQGHIIADSLGGVANAYNITPQESTLNRHGDQAYMEKFIRDVGGCSGFVATITYAKTDTQIPSAYRYEYVLNGELIVDEFANVNPDDYNTEQGVYNAEKPEESKVVSGTGEEDVSKVDTNANGIVTIKEAKAAGYAMPITSDHWLYQYMTDQDGDGMVGE